MGTYIEQHCGNSTTRSGGPKRMPREDEYLAVRAKLTPADRRWVYASVGPDANTCSYCPPFPPTVTIASADPD